jgi:hypothetical protein
MISAVVNKISWIMLIYDGAIVDYLIYEGGYGPS